jgi:plasmid maintenance system antidote protein VapI
VTADEVRELLRKKGLQKQIADDLRVTNGYVSELINGKTALTKKVLDYLGVEVVYRRKDEAHK